jgi:phage portal protein BeeE
MGSRWSTLTRSSGFTIDDYVGMMNDWQLEAGGAGSYTQTLQGQTAEPIPHHFIGYVRQAYKANSVAFACHLTRLMLFAQIRFAYRTRNRQSGRPGDLFYTSELGVLERPWPGGTTGDMAGRMIQDADFAGNAYLTVIDGRVHRMRPDFVSIVLGSESEPDDPDVAIDSTVLGYFYAPPGRTRPRMLLPEQVAHFAPLPDPEANYRGMSWLTPVLRELKADQAATTHKLKFFENAATPNIIIKHETGDLAKVRQFASWFREQQEGAANAYRTLHLTAGSDPEVVGKDFRELDFKATQGAGETRIAAAAGVHPTIVGLSEGMQGSSLNAGNFSAARRLTADRTLRFLWSNAASSLSTLVPQIANAELAYDPRDVPFLQEDEKDAAQIHREQAATIASYITAGFTPDSAVLAVVNGDPTLLEHTGLVSVQLLPPGNDLGADQGDTP